MSFLTRVQQMNAEASALENRCENIYLKIKNVQPFEGPGLEKNLRQIGSDVTKLSRTLAQLTELPGRVSQDDATKINDLWGEIKVSLTYCNTSLSAGREYLEKESILVSLATFIKEITKEIGSVIANTLRLADKTIKGLLKGSS